MEPHAVPPTSPDAERAVRRVRSEGDLPPADDLPHHHTALPHACRRNGRTHVSFASQGQWAPPHMPPPPAAAPASGTSSAAHTPRPPSPPLARPTPLVLHTPRRVRPEEMEEADLTLQGWGDLPEELRNELVQVSRNRGQRAQRVPAGWWGKVLVFFGQVGPDARVRSKLMSFVWSSAFGLVQFVVIVTLLAYSSHHESPTMPGETEWHACERPLGAWNAIWIIRVFFGVLYAFWSYRNEVKFTKIERERERDRQSTASDPEALFTSLPPRRARSAPSSPRTRSHPTSPASPRFNNTTPPEPDQVERTVPALLARLGNLTDALGIVWFLTAHILVYTSVKTCRFAAPHLWWLSFSILCILYFMILEVFLVGLIVFIFWPVFYLAWNIFLLIIGRHPMQRTPLKHEIGKLPKSVVDQIPLVLYIPPPPDDPAAPSSPAAAADGTMKTPAVPYTYPPLPPRAPPRKRRFAFLRRARAARGAGAKAGAGGDGERWEDNWVPGEYPFVRLEGNRAACAVCLMDFEAPARREGAEKAERERAAAEGAAGEEGGEGVQEVRVEEVTREDARTLKLEDAGEGAQPLRLLPCGHVFHKTCVDPWLTDVSGRCPVCQRPVEIPKEGKSKK